MGDDESEAIRRPAKTPPFEDLFRAQFARVARAMMLVVRDTDLGRDIAQEAFVRLYQRYREMSSEQHAVNYVFRVGLNLARSHHRRARRLAVHPAEDPSPPVDEQSRVETRMVVFDALGRLSPKQRAAVVLIDYVGFSDADVASSMGVRPSTVRVHLARGRAALRSALSDTYSKEDRL